MSLKYPKSVRLLKRRQFQRMTHQSKSLVGRLVIIDIRQNHLPQNRLGITVSRRFGKSHERNRFKRIVREAFRLNLKSMSGGYDMNIRPRSAAKTAMMDDIVQEFIHLGLLPKNS